MTFKQELSQRLQYGVKYRLTKWQAAMNALLELPEEAVKERFRDEEEERLLSKIWGEELLERFDVMGTDVPRDCGNWKKFIRNKHVGKTWVEAVATPGFAKYVQFVARETQSPDFKLLAGWYPNRIRVTTQAAALQPVGDDKGQGPVHVSSCILCCVSYFVLLVNKTRRNI